MPTRQHSRRHSTQRLMLLAGATIGIGTALILGTGDDASADARDHTELADGVAATTAVPPKPALRPARDLVDQARETTDRTTQVVGPAVDKARSLTGPDIGAATIPRPAPAPPLTPPEVDLGASTGRRSAGAKPAPEPAETGAPTPPPAGSGAATPWPLAVGVWQHPTAAIPVWTATCRAVIDPGQSVVRLTSPRQYPALDTSSSSGDARPPAVVSGHLDGILGDRSTHVHGGPQFVVGQDGDHSGRSWPPSSPAG